MSKLSDDVSKKLKDTKESIQFLTDHIVEIDADKEAYDSGIEKIDRDLVSQLNAVNQTIGDVATAYDARITVGCRTDMFWRVKQSNWEVFYTDHIKANYINEKPKEYNNYRKRMTYEFREKLLNKYGIKGWVKLEK